MKPALSVYRAILTEIRLMGLQTPQLKTDLVATLSREFKLHKVTEERYCRANESALFYARTLLENLRSTRHHQRLSAMYKGKGERSTEDAANLVGLTLPKTYS